MEATKQPEPSERQAGEINAHRAGRRRFVPYLVIALLAIALGLGIFRQHGANNISPCVVNYVCDQSLDSMRGDYRVTQRGFPAAYRITETFTRRPSNGASYGTVLRAVQPFNPLLALVNVIFWFALLGYLWHWFSKLRDGTFGRSRARNKLA